MQTFFCLAAGFGKYVSAVWRQTNCEVRRLNRDDMPKRPADRRNGRQDAEDPVPENIYPVIDTDLARDNLENDIPQADLEDLR